MSKKLDELLRELKLPTFVAHHAETAAKASSAGWGFERYLQSLTEAEVEQRHQKRLERLLRASKLPQEKTLTTLDAVRLPTPVRRMLPSLCEGGFVDRAENLLAFGLPGRGKTHLVCAIGFELIQRGYSVHFTPTYASGYRTRCVLPLALLAEPEPLYSACSPQGRRSPWKRNCSD